MLYYSKLNLAGIIMVMFIFSDRDDDI